jgi:predicted protein tyrosine phosphatase
LLVSAESNTILFSIAPWNESDSKLIFGRFFIMNILFICSRNKWRSPTGEAIFRNSPVHQARSAGTSDSARIRVSQSLIDWADLVFVMEKKHLQILRSMFTVTRQVVVLDIPDEYQYMDQELVEMLRDAVTPYLD